MSDTQKAIGPSFSDELAAAGFIGQPFVWDANGNLFFPEGTSQSIIAGVEAVYAAHNPATIPPATQALSAISAGLTIASTATPALNGTYAIDQLSQMDIIAIETSLNAGKGFPGGAAAFNYADTSGVMHAFSAANFADFAAAVRDYMYGLKSVIAGASATLPISTAAIA